MGAAIGLGSVFKIGGGLLGVYSSIAGAQAQASSYRTQAAIAEQNARTAEAQANESLARGAREERRFRQRADQSAAGQESQLAASGAALSGSALHVMGDTQLGIEEDVTALRYNALQERWAHQVQAVDFRNQASAARAAAKNARTAGYIGAGASILGTMASIGASRTPTKATYKAGSGISVEPRYEAFYNSPRNTFGTVTDNMFTENWWDESNWHKKGR